MYQPVMSVFLTVWSSQVKPLIFYRQNLKRSERQTIYFSNLKLGDTLQSRMK